MELAVYLQKPLPERQQIVKSPVQIHDPYWLERLKTAVSNLNPFAVMFNQDLINEYWNLKQTS
ncbi:hypothetical protein PFY12_14730 [Chryseobacterium camelliae]|uniref:Uncharacterized protein n=1 Tax=Chryseobacterium camelliae TaxID=1265445 RepID=A0ABY7QNJ2_9FLAO|nr:hypothetical protein [Chryseobacterium camelliae]WBV60281.1 hypothetical protein PFY12_14730 [Chryseobacterium camelliae]